MQWKKLFVQQLATGKFWQKIFKQDFTNHQFLDRSDAITIIRIAQLDILCEVEKRIGDEQSSVKINQLIKEITDADESGLGLQ
jgi:hypothetical protein